MPRSRRIHLPALTQAAFLTFTMILFGGACTHFGEVHASYPRVFSSQRLVRHRLNETQWLEKKLEQSFEPGFRSITDRRQRKQLVVQGSGAVGPDAVLAQLGDADLSASESSASLPNPSTAAVTGAKLDPLEQLEDERAYRDRVGLMMRDLMLDDVHDANGNTLYQLNFDLTMIPAGKRGEPAIAAFRVDRAQSAEFSSAEIDRVLEQTLTNIGAEAGARLVAFRNSLTAPASSEERQSAALMAQQVVREQLAGVRQELSFSVSMADRLIEAIEDKGARQRSAFLRDIERFDHPQPGDQKFEQWARKKADELGVETLQFRGLKNKLEGAGKVVTDWSNSEDADAILSPDVRLIVERAFLSRGGYPPWVAFRRGADGNIDPRPVRDEVLRRMFHREVQELLDEVDGACVSVLMDSPTEYAQNHSDVSALSDVFQSSLQLAVTNGTAKVSSSVDQLTETQTLLQSIKRTPLLLAFGRGRSHFGWMMGPSYSIENFRPKFTHKPVHHSVSAQVVVPRLAGKIFLESGYAWLDGVELCDAGGGEIDGDLDHPGGLSPMWATNGNCVCIDLPADIELRRFARHGWDRAPVVTSFQGGLVEGRAKQSVVVLGHNLWRSPRVFVGGRAADRVDVLPDMAGVEATFLNFAPIADSDLRPDSLPLRVSTSHGTATAYPKIRIHRNPEVAQFVTSIPNGQALVEKGTVKIGYDPALLPKRFHALFLTLRRVGKPGWSAVDGLPRINPAQQQLVFDVRSLPTNTLWGSFDAADFELGLMIQLSPLEDAKRVKAAAGGGPVLGKVLVFKKKAAAAAKAAPSTLTLDAAGNPSSLLKLTIDALVSRLHAPMVSGTSVEIAAKSKAGKSAKITATWSGRQLELPAATLKPLVSSFKNADELTLTVSYGSGASAKSLAVATRVKIKR